MRLRLLRSVPRQEAEAEYGRSDSFDDLYERYGADIKRWARQLAGPRGDLEDLLHDVFVIALRHPFVGRGQGSVKTWLFRITHNVVRSRRRRGLIRGILSRRHQDEAAAATPAPATPQEEVERQERHALLYDALAHLTDSYRTALILYEIEGLSAEEIAELTGTSPGTVCVRLHRGRAKLIQHLLRKERR